MMVNILDRMNFCRVSECGIYDGCPLKGTVQVCTRWNLPDRWFYDDDIEWQIEMPMKLVKPLAMTSQGLIYKCVRCGAIFEYDRLIHVPHCENCRLEELDRLSEDIQKDATPIRNWERCGS